jgi:hypothetical protein
MSTKLVSVVVGFMKGVLLYRLTDEGMPLKCDITLRLSLPLMSILRNKYCSKKCTMSILVSVVYWVCKDLYTTVSPAGILPAALIITSLGAYHSHVRQSYSFFFDRVRQSYSVVWSF